MAQKEPIENGYLLYSDQLPLSHEYEFKKKINMVSFQEDLKSCTFLFLDAQRHLGKNAKKTANVATVGFAHLISIILLDAATIRVLNILS